jgi:hypothetical protein
MVSQDTDNAKLKEALRLAELGYPILPCKPGEKAPATRYGLKDSTTTPFVIRSWFDQGRLGNFNIAIQTAGLLVVDIDPGADWPGDPDQEAELNKAPTASTPRGGRHHFFRGNGKYRNTAGKIAEHVDTRANGGYILVSPSTVNGSCYEWINALDRSKDRLPPPPQFVLDALKRPKPKAQDAPQVNGQQTLALTVPYDLSNHPGASEGQRNATLCELVGRHLAQVGTDRVADLALAWGRRCSPPMPEAQVVKSVESLVRKHQETASASTPSTTGKPRPSAGVSLEIISGDEVEIEPVSWLWKGRLPSGMISLTSGDPGLGKTSAVIDIAARVTTGTDFPDGSPAPQGNILFYTLEDTFRHTIVPRFIAAGGDRSRLKLVGAMRRADGREDILLFDRDLDRLRETIEIIGNVKLLIVDPLSATLGDVNENISSEVRGVLGPLSRMAEETDVCVWGIGHHSKGAEVAVHCTDRGRG